MKKIIPAIVTLLFTISFGFSQDIITKKSEENIKAKVLEITNNEIKYKKYDNINGPTYTIPASDVLTIRYENGQTEIFNQADKKNNKNNSLKIDFTGFGSKFWADNKIIQRAEFKALISSNIEAESAYRLGQNLRINGLLISIPSAVVLGWQIGNSINGEKTNTPAIVLGGVGVVGGIALGFIGLNKMVQAVNIFNKKNSSNGSSFHFLMGPNSVRFALKF